ncbi:MAG TPA: cytochrome c [Geomonas sp.]|nr:cytochrome c [Geomonas sp.]
MASPFAVLGCSISLLIIPLLSSSALAEDGKELFQKQCSSCHTIGGGNGVGPDLQGVAARRSAEWLVRVITEPDQLAADKDPAQLELVKKFGMEMPKLGISAEDAKKLVAFLQGGAAGAQGAPSAAPSTTAAAPPAAAPSAPVPATPQMIAAGRALFTGKTPFTNGGSPCVSCHNLRYPDVYGGALAADLTTVYSGMGESGMRGVLKSLGFPVMRQVYANRPLTDAETTALLAFFQDASARNAKERNPYPFTGLGCFVVFVIAALIYKRRIG